MTNFGPSSDDARSAKPLKHAQYVTFSEPLQLEHGGVLPSVTVCYETFGTLNLDKSNAVLICHALSGDSHVGRHDEGDDPGWWDVVVGPGRPIDTNRYFVICPNILGGCRGTTGPGTTNPATGKPYGGDFPVITQRDMVELQKRLIDHLRIQKLLAVVGGSMGGHAVLTWGTLHPDRLNGAIVLASCARLTNQSLAFDIVGRNAIIRDPHFHNGDYYDRTAPHTGLAVARMLAHITYLSHQSMAQKFEGDRLQPRKLQTEFETRFSVGSYLAYQGHRFVERFDANAYISLTTAMDLFDLGGTPQKLAATFANSQCRWLIVSFSTDWLFPPFQSEEMVHALLATHKPVTYCEVASNAGHDAFLLSDDLDRYGELIRAFLHHLASPAQFGWRQTEKLAADAHSPTSIFHGDRLDYNLITELIPQQAKVLDLGCGSGALLAKLKSRGHLHILGVELDEQAIVACARRGVDVIRADLNNGLPSISDQHFDYVVLSQTLQTVLDVEKILADCLRVGKRTIVSFPNFAYAPLRQFLSEQGRAPRTADNRGLLGHAWYNTPNLRFLSIADFEDFCREKQIRIEQLVALNTERGERITIDPNLNADLAIFVITH